MEDNIKKFEGFLDRMQGLLDNAKKQGHIIVRVEDLENAFPELKESEDERIRIGLIGLFNDMEWGDSILHDYNIDKDKTIAWLEKLGQQDDYNDNIITRDDEILQAISIGLADAEKDLGWSDFGGLPIEEIQEWLEKQGESKYIPKYKIGDYVKNTNYKGEPIYEIIYMDKECYICEYRGKESMGDKAVMHFSFDNPYLRLVQKPVDIEQNFSNSEKVGKNDTILDLLQKIPSCITVDEIDYHFVMKKTIAYMAFYEGEGEGSGKVIFWMAGDPVDIMTEMLEKLKRGRAVGISKDEKKAFRRVINDTAIEDLEKAIWYINDKIKTMKNETDNRNQVRP